jgi:predicted nucleic acid-binding protein
MTIYAESSAILTWLLGEDRHDAVGALLQAAEEVVTSSMTSVETDRTLIRTVQLGELSESEAAAKRIQFNQTSGRWLLLALEDDIIARARNRFPMEPVRALDALHLASALAAREAVADLIVLSLDSVVRKNAGALGFEVLPA